MPSNSASPPTKEALALAQELMPCENDDMTPWQIDAIVNAAALRIDAFAKERAAQDTARLDWLQANRCDEGRHLAGPVYSFRVAQWEGTEPNLRAAIDSLKQAEAAP